MVDKLIANEFVNSKTFVVLKLKEKGIKIVGIIKMVSEHNILLVHPIFPRSARPLDDIDNDITLANSCDENFHEFVITDEPFFEGKLVCRKCGNRIDNPNGGNKNVDA